MAENLKVISQLLIGGQQYEIKDAYARQRIEDLTAGGITYIGRAIGLTDIPTYDEARVYPFVENAEYDYIVFSDKSVNRATKGDLVLVEVDGKDCEFIYDGEQWDMLGAGPFGALAYKNSVEGSFSWEHNHEFEDEDATIEVLGATSGVAVADHKCKPEGTIEIGSGDVNYTPEGTVTLGGLTANEVAITGSTAQYTEAAHDYTPAGSVSVNVAEDANGNYQPKGTINPINFAGAQATLAHEAHKHGAEFQGDEIAISAHNVTQGTVTGDVTADFVGTAASLEVKGTVAVSGTLATGSASLANRVAVTNAANSDVVVGDDNEILELDFTSLVKSVELKREETITYATGAFEQALSAEFTGENIAYTPAGRIDNGKVVNGKTVGVAVADHEKITPAGTIIVNDATVGAHTYTPAGTIDQPIFTGVPVMISAAFNGTQATLSHKAHSHDAGTLRGSVEVPTTAAFAGKGVNLVFKGVEKTLTHTVTQGSVAASGTYKKFKGIKNAKKDITVICQ